MTLGASSAPADFRKKLVSDCNSLLTGWGYVFRDSSGGTSTSNIPADMTIANASSFLVGILEAERHGSNVLQRLTVTGRGSSVTSLVRAGIAGFTQQGWTRRGAYFNGTLTWGDWQSEAESRLLWTEATLQSNLAHIGTHPVRYAKAGNLVFIQGACNVIDYKIDTEIFTLPTGYRPEKVVYFGGCFYDNATGLMYEGTMQVNWNGDVSSIVTRPNYSIPAYSNFRLGGCFHMRETETSL